MTKISVLMPVYNTEEEYLREAIQSILNQTFADFEFIIVNDGSTNNAEDVILSYDDKRIKYFKQENTGIVGALNNGWKHACGEYIARMDSDDTSFPERFEKQVKFLDENPQISLVGTFVRKIYNGQIIKHPEVVKIIDLLADNVFIHPSVMFRKSDFEKYGIKYCEGFEYAEDYAFYARAIRCLEMRNFPDVLLNYRIYPENSSSKNRDMRIISSFKVQDLILDYLSSDKSIQAGLLDIAYKRKFKTNRLNERIFSIKNLYKNWAKYKTITIFGFEFLMLDKKYTP